jgi:hypothetical protein
MTRSRGAAVLAATAVATVLSLCRPAAAYVRYKTDSGNGFFWGQISVPITAYPNDFVQPTMTADQVDTAALDAANTWSAGENPCTYLNLMLSVSTDPTPIAGYDHRNTLVFRSTSWCMLAANGACDADYDSRALALTSDTANKKTGQIYDSDIEINTVDYNWADVTSDASLSGDMDLQNAITHEMGHLIGLNHTCYDPLSGMPQPTDNNGQPVPDCDQASLAVQATTMYPSAMMGDTQKRTLAPDDQAGLCGIYPVDDPPQPAGGCAACATVPTPVDRLELAGFGILAALLAYGRRARRVARR